jgi:SAM-dependent methyltransferase
MVNRRQLPRDYLLELRELEESYLTSNDPIRQSGFGGGPERWRGEREPILDAVESDGDLLDACCANGFLLECLVKWGRERGREIRPHGLDAGERLVELARQRLARHSANMHVGNVWDWRAPRTYDYVYVIDDCVPSDFLPELVLGLRTRMVAPGGRLIVGSYGSRSRDLAPLDVAEFLSGLGLDVVGTASGGEPPVTAFAWIDNERK